ncbi:hypothetical protein [Oscillibacter sp.]|uniref:hypothetical protein n=1 Tax=Oscillibacter sp. TaxID=1945593 RepID=UPI00289DA7EF|nr:hypothetical protein [Oscillibacter sp.]
MTEQERADALKVVTSIIARCEQTQPKFAPGTSQHTLLKNRIQALKIGSALLGGGYVEKDSDETLTAALEPLASIIRKCEKARSKYEPGSGQYNRYGSTIQAMELSRIQIENELHRRTL